MDMQSRSPARLLAPVALVVFAIALLVVLTTAGGGEKSKDASSETRQEQRDLELQRQRRQAKQARQAKRGNRLPQNVYVVKTGDTLGSIAQKTGIPVEKLQELNPNLDPQALVSGQRLKLR
ncbi:MAG TPA: LysM peptidoglycan-binding domain-containing protein [Thermoleophilaceae bacterium]|jgi:LysM repeat protein